MGSFNVTCSVTGLPIRWNDLVVAIPVKPNKDNIEDIDLKKLPVWSHYFYTICGLPIHGKYYDYGRIEYEVNDSATKIYEKMGGEGEIWTDGISLIVMHRAAYEYLISWEWKNINGDDYLYNRILNRNKEKIEHAIEYIRNDDRFGMHSIYEINNGFVSYYHSNPLLSDKFQDLELIWNYKGEDFELNYRTYEIEFNEKVFPIIEASGALNFKLDPPMYENQTGNIKGAIEQKTIMFNLITEDKKSYDEYFDELEE